MSRNNPLEKNLKEILYTCIEDIQATKAALYLKNEKEDYFELVSEYGFRDQIRHAVTPDDAMVDRLIIKRAPYFVNGENTAGFESLLRRSNTSKLLVAPIYSYGKLVGFVDMRDKAGKRPFVQEDVEGAQRVVDQILHFFGERDLYGQSLEPADVDEPAELNSPTWKLIEEARAALALRPHPDKGVLSEAQLAAGSVVLPLTFNLHGALISALSSFGSVGGKQVVASRSPLADDTLRIFQERTRQWSRKHNEADQISQTNVVYPFGEVGRVITPDHIVSILSARVLIPSKQAIVLTVGFEESPSPDTLSTLEGLLAQAQLLITHAISHDRLREMNQRTAETLLMPDFALHRELEAHSTRVSEMAERFASFLLLPSDEVETIRLAAYLHDVGMRLLDYDTLYRKAAPTSDDLRLLREHPTLGAAIIAKSALPREIAELVLYHHERPDGTGPLSRSDEEIPLGSKIIHLCEAFDAMTSPESYHAAVSLQAALSQIRRAGGTQFDAQLTQRFYEMLSPH